MISIEDYYKAPNTAIFEEIKKESIKIWETYGDPYKTDKVNRIKDLINIKDNAMYMVQMFDHINKAKLLEAVSPETGEYINERL